MREPVCLQAEFRPVPGYAGYRVSAQGEIIGPAGKFMRPMQAKTGHRFILTRRPGVPRRLYVHRAVLLAFVGPCPPGSECRHLDGDSSNNDVENLRWGTRQENSDDKQRHGTQTRGVLHPPAKLTEADVVEIRRLHGTVSLRELGRRFGVSHTAILRAATGRKWRHVR